MPSLTVRLSDFEAALLEDLVRQTGESKTALVINGLRILSTMYHEDKRSVRLSAKDFDSLLRQLDVGSEVTSEQPSCKQELLKGTPVWEA